MAIPGIIVGIVLGLFLGPFGILLIAPLMTAGVLLFFIFPPLRPLGVGLFMMSIGLAIGMVIGFLIVAWIVFGDLLSVGVIF